MTEIWKKFFYQNWQFYSQLSQSYPWRWSHLGLLHIAFKSFLKHCFYTAINLLWSRCFLLLGDYVKNFTWCDISSVTLILRGTIFTMKNGWRVLGVDSILHHYFSCVNNLGKLNRSVFIIPIVYVPLQFHCVIFGYKIGSKYTNSWHLTMLPIHLY